MSDKPLRMSRRDAVKTLCAGLVAVPVMNLVATAAAYAQDLPHVDPATDPMAQALKYVHDATTADRAAAARPGLDPSEQHCGNCNFQMPKSEAEWVPCSLFPGKAVNTNGWCASWTLRVG
jgi:hypothetical protein